MGRREGGKEVEHGREGGRERWIEGELTGSCLVLQEMKKAREFLSKLNNHLARAVSILFFIFVTNTVNGNLSLFPSSSPFLPPSLPPSLFLYTRQILIE